MIRTILLLFTLVVTFLFFAAAGAQVRLREARARRNAAIAVVREAISMHREATATDLEQACWSGFQWED